MSSNDIDQLIGTIDQLSHKLNDSQEKVRHHSQSASSVILSKAVTMGNRGDLDNSTGIGTQIANCANNSQLVDTHHHIQTTNDTENSQLTVNYQHIKTTNDTDNSQLAGNYQNIQTTNDTDNSKLADTHQINESNNVEIISSNQTTHLTDKQAKASDLQSKDKESVG